MIEGVIYCYTSPSNKCYIGQTINRKLRRSDGGDKIYDWTGIHKSEEWKRKMSEIQKNVVFSPERCRNISIGRKKPILQYSLQGEFVKEWESAKDVPFARQNALVQCLKGRSKTCAGFQWKYKDEKRNICSNSTNTA